MAPQQPPPVDETPRVRAPDFPARLEWVNTGGRALTIGDLRGKIVLLDFWTYGWINCLHVLPQLRELEHHFPNELAVVGVHSGKYIAERDTARIREAANRLGVTHPIVNDRQFRVWRAYAVRAWPTLVIVDPQGYAVVSHAGEFTSAMVAPVIERLIEAAPATGALRRESLESPVDPPAVAPGTLRYPGKVALDASRTRIAIADTGHHRVLVGTLADSGRRMRVDRVVGSGTAGLRDAAESTAAELALPNGIAFATGPTGSDMLYVADTGNHAVRAVELATGAVRTLAGTGRRLRTRADRAAGAMASPWDVAVVGSTLYVAMAGLHQIWALDLATGAPRLHAGQGGEDIRDDALAEALLAQPMGLAADVAAGRLYFVDAESSAVRWADLDPLAGRVTTIVGTGLFDFGDADGVGDAVRMQHQQGLALHESGRLLVADSYDDALKWVDPATRRVETWVRGFHEPGGVAIGRGVVYVADTNAHRVAVVSEASGEIGELAIEGAGPRA